MCFRPHSVRDVTGALGLHPQVIMSAETCVAETHPSAILLWVGKSRVYSGEWIAECQACIGLECAMMKGRSTAGMLCPFTQESNFCKGSLTLTLASPHLYPGCQAPTLHLHLERQRLHGLRPVSGTIGSSLFSARTVRRGRRERPVQLWTRALDTESFLNLETSSEALSLALIILQSPALNPSTPLSIPLRRVKLPRRLANGTPINSR